MSFVFGKGRKVGGNIVEIGLLLTARKEIIFYKLISAVFRPHHRSLPRYSQTSSKPGWLDERSMVV
jgi:hypothetical protein